MHNIARWRLKWTQKHSFHAFTSRYPSFTRRKRAFLLPTDKKTSLRLHISFSRKKFDHESRRNARVKETYRNSLRGIGLITREPVGFLLDLGRFHQRSHHFLSLFSLSKYGEFSSSAFLLCVFGAERKHGKDDWWKKEEKKIWERVKNLEQAIKFYIHFYIESNISNNLISFIHPLLDHV